MVPSWLSVVASVGMAVGPPLVYADQATSIIRKKFDGFLKGCLWSAAHREYHSLFLLAWRWFRAAIVNSIHFNDPSPTLLYICMMYRPRLSPENLVVSSRPYSFWQWPTYSQHIEVLAGLILVQSILFLIFGRSPIFVWILGFVSLGLESTLPIPQFISNYKQKSLYGFRASTLLGWVGGDAFKTVYFFMKPTPLQFKICAIFQLSIDFAIVAQRLYYGNSPPTTTLLEDDDIEQALALTEE